MNSPGIFFTMPIPKPNSGEPQSTFMGRCVTFLVDEGTPQEQALAICYNQYAEANKLEHHKKYMAFKAIESKRRRYEKSAARKFHAALLKQLDAYLKEVERLGSIDIDLTGVVTTEPIQAAYLDVYQNAMPTFARDTYNYLLTQQRKTNVNWDILVSQWLNGSEFLQASSTTTKIVGVTAFTQRRIEAQVYNALKDGTPVPKFASQLRNDYGFSLKRGMTIGRTEIVAASNAGSLLGAQASGVAASKVWLSTIDGRTRSFAVGKFDHIIMDGQKATELKGNFDVNGEPMQYPGDSSQGASPGNTINCRCTIIYEPIKPEFLT